MADKKEVQTVLTPEGRLINESLFEKNKFDENSTPTYSIELAFEPDDLADVEKALGKAAADKWGAGAEDDYFEGRIRDPLLDGNKLAKGREKKGKAGDAYKALVVIRAHTIFNKHGQDAPGGVAVYGPDVAEIGPAQRQEVYSGCYGQAALTIDFYEERDGQHALMFYLQAFQKTKDGERLVTQRDYSEVFKPVGRTEGEGTKRRRSRS